jgi:phage terminase large subunit-like protein
MTVLDAAPALDVSSLARWRVSPITLIEECLHDAESRRPYRLLPAERAFLAHAFKTDDSGRLLYPEQVYACPKKSGKTAFAAMHTLATTLLFGSAFPEAVICANDLEQSVGRVFEAIRKIVVCSPLLKREAKITESRITFPAIDATITAIASDYAGAAGGNQCIAAFDELWAVTSERGRRLWDELVPPPTRKIACRLTVSYAGFEAESELLEGLYKRGLAQPQIGKDLYAGDGLLMFWSHEPVAPWQDERWLADMRRSLRPGAYLRMVENRWVSTESTFIDLAWWDACVDPAVTPLVARPSLQVTIGIDASVKRDSTAIVVTHWDRQRQRVVLVTHRIYQPAPDDPLDFETCVEATVLDLHARFQVRQVLYDPFQMASTAQRLQRAGVRMQEYPQSVPNLTQASQNLFELIKGRNIVAYPDDAIRLALSRAVAVEGSRGWKISKEKQSHRIDVVIALAMAALSAIQTQSIYRYDTTLSFVSGPDDKTAEQEFLEQRMQAHILRFGGQRRW